MDFRVGPPGSNLYDGGTSSFLLRKCNQAEDNFNTLYELFYFGDEYIGEEVYIGKVKILKKGQLPNQKFALRKSFDSLGPDYISVGQSLDYYQRVTSLGQKDRQKILNGLNDFLYSPEQAEEFHTETGWKSSLFREFDETDDFLVFAKSLVIRDLAILPENLKFSFQVTGWESPVAFDFSPITSKNCKISDCREIIPNRIFAIIGRNGSGKSTLLARLARVAHGTERDRLSGAFDNLGTITPSNISFPRIITISYSAFDSFRLPGVGPENPDFYDERLQIIRDINTGGGRFIFCGLRDISTELENEMETPPSKSNWKTNSDKLNNTLLKPIEELASEFKRTVTYAHENNAWEVLDEALKCIAEDPSFDSESVEFTTRALIANGLEKQFLQWSTGHKIVMQILASLAAYTTHSSLILLDEPETHLHPPLLAALMHAIRLILDKRKSFAIVATHAPVVLQETLARHVYTVRREGSLTDVYQSRIETFGENISTLSAEILALTPNLQTSTKYSTN
ncbi:AAA family ATPase [uncultured Pseudomonas sp.]|uniref:AAA family ATPase n=1 Tax=uncultured Pseudomonas sp. TaxID=114707 RepID=UPI0025D131D9|nr:AAA family ATPase [uncultured Pseudomonas sp.]